MKICVFEAAYILMCLHTCEYTSLTNKKTITGSLSWGLGLAVDSHLLAICFPIDQYDETCLLALSDHSLMTGLV